jgi:hypothetical protein
MILRRLHLLFVTEKQRSNLSKSKSQSSSARSYESSEEESIRNQVY